MADPGFAKYPLDRRIQQLDVNCQTSMNVRLDKLIFHRVTESEFTNNILPNETNNSVNVYFVHTQSEIQLWKGNIRINFGGGSGEEWTVGVICLNSFTN